MKKTYYIAYGSNLHTGQMAYRCPNAKVLGSTVLKNWRLMFKGSKSGNYATIEPCIGESVPVVVWEITPSDERSLDRYEGFPTFYFKSYLDVIVNGQQVHAMVYLMRLDAVVGYPSTRYIDTLQVGYDSFGFDVSVLQEALERCM